MEVRGDGEVLVFLLDGENVIEGFCRKFKRMKIQILFDNRFNANCYVLGD